MNTLATYRSFAFTTRSPLAVSRAFRERVLASLAFVMLIIAWDATLRLDEHVSPARSRTTHAVELVAEPQARAIVR